MTDQNNEARDMWAEALSLMFKGDHQEELFRISDDEIDALEGLSPDRWPTAGQTDINWDLSVPGRRHSIYLPGPRVLQAILHIAKGWPVSPVLLSVHEDGGFHFGDGTHRYEVLKRSGTPHFYFLAMPDDVSAINKQLTFQWMSD